MPALAIHRSRKLIPDFRLKRPRSASEAVAMKIAGGDGAAFMAGGIDLVNRLKFGTPLDADCQPGRAGSQKTRVPPISATRVRTPIMTAWRQRN